MWCMQRERVFAFGSSTTLGAVLFLWKSYIRNFLSVLWFKMLWFLIWFYMHQMGEVGVGTYFSVMSLMTGKQGDFTLSLSMFLPKFQGGWVMMLRFGSWIVYGIFYVHSFYNQFENQQYIMRLVINCWAFINSQILTIKDGVIFIISLKINNICIWSNMFQHLDWCSTTSLQLLTSNHDEIPCLKFHVIWTSMKFIGIIIFWKLFTYLMMLICSYWIKCPIMGWNGRVPKGFLDFTSNGIMLSALGLSHAYWLTWEMESSLCLF